MTFAEEMAKISSMADEDRKPYELASKARKHIDTAFEWISTSGYDPEAVLGEINELTRLQIEICAINPDVFDDSLTRDYQVLVRLHDMILRNNDMIPMGGGVMP